MDKRFLVSAVVVLFSLLLVNSVFANGILVDGIGAIESARGRTNIAHADNGVLILDNPGALGRMQKERIDASLCAVKLPMSYKDAENDRNGKEPIHLLPAFSYTGKIDAYNLGFGVGIFSPAALSTEYNLRHFVPLYGEQKYYSFASHTKALIGAGYKITDTLSFGIACGPSYSKVKLQMPYSFQTGLLKGAPALIDTDGDDWAFAWNIGTQWEITPQTTLGLAYIHGDKFSMEGDLDLRFKGGILPSPPFPPTDLDAHYKLSLDFEWPQIVGAGIVHRIDSKHRLSLDVVWVDWSSAFDELTFELTQGTGALGPSAQDTLPLHWKDSYTLRFGYEYFLNEKDVLRFGYAYNQNPVRSSALTPLIPGIHVHAITLGYGHEWEHWAFNCGLYHSFKNTESAGTSEIVGGDFDNSAVDFSIWGANIGVQYTF